MKIDVWLIILLSLMPTFSGIFGSDEASKYISPFWLWVARSICAVLGGGLGAWKGVRFKNGNGNGNGSTVQTMNLPGNGTAPPFKP